MVLACEVGGRRSEETNNLFCSLRNSPTIEDERQTELAVEVEVDSRVCLRQSVRPVTVGTEGWNRS